MFLLFTFFLFFTERESVEDNVDTSDNELCTSSGSHLFETTAFTKSCSSCGIRTIRLQDIPFCMTYSIKNKIPSSTSMMPCSSKNKSQGQTLFSQILENEQPSLGLETAKFYLLITKLVFSIICKGLEKK